MSTADATPASARPATAAVPRALPLLLALAGLVVSGVLEWVHVKTYLMPSVDSFCAVNDRFDCGTVALSRFSVVLGIPLPVWGAAGFIAMATAAWGRLRLLWPLAAFATVVSILLLLEELLYVGSVCLMCEAVHALALALAVVAFIHHRRRGVSLSAGALVRVGAPPTALLIASAVATPRYWIPLSWQQGVPVPHGVDDEGRPWVGATDPSHVVEEFVDYGCPHCAIATNHTRRRLTAPGNRLRIVRRHQPRKRCHERNHGCVGQRAAHCAGEQGKFWEMDTWLFAHMPGRYDVDVLEGARALGLDEPLFVLCLEDPATYAWADAESKLARRLGITVTPTYRIDGHKYLPDEYQAWLDAGP